MRTKGERALDNANAEIRRILRERPVDGKKLAEATRKRDSARRALFQLRERER